MTMQICSLCECAFIRLVILLVNYHLPVLLQGTVQHVGVERAQYKESVGVDQTSDKEYDFFLTISLLCH